MVSRVTAGCTRMLKTHPRTAVRCCAGFSSLLFPGSEFHSRQNVRLSVQCRDMRFQRRITCRTFHTTSVLSNTDDHDDDDDWFGVDGDSEGDEGKLSSFVPGLENVKTFVSSECVLRAYPSRTRANCQLDNERFFRFKRVELLLFQTLKQWKRSMKQH